MDVDDDAASPPPEENPEMELEGPVTTQDTGDQILPTQIPITNITLQELRNNYKNLQSTLAANIQSFPLSQRQWDEEDIESILFIKDIIFSTNTFVSNTDNEIQLEPQWNVWFNSQSPLVNLVKVYIDLYNYLNEILNYCEYDEVYEQDQQAAAIGQTILRQINFKPTQSFIEIMSWEKEDSFIQYSEPNEEENIVEDEINRSKMQRRGGGPRKLFKRKRNQTNPNSLVENIMFKVRSLIDYGKTIAEFMTMNVEFPDPKLFYPEIQIGKGLTSENGIQTYCSVLNRIWERAYAPEIPPRELDELVVIDVPNDIAIFKDCRKNVEAATIQCAKQIELFIALLDGIKYRQQNFIPNVKDGESILKKQTHKHNKQTKKQTQTQTTQTKHTQNQKTKQKTN